MLDTMLDLLLDRLSIRMTLSRFVWHPISTATRKTNTVVSWTTWRLRTEMLWLACETFTAETGDLLNT
jgi:hypothetical protein